MSRASAPNIWQQDASESVAEGLQSSSHEDPALDGPLPPNLAATAHRAGPSCRQSKTEVWTFSFSNEAGNGYGQLSHYETVPRDAPWSIRSSFEKLPGPGSQDCTPDTFAPQQSQTTGVTAGDRDAGRPRATEPPSDLEGDEQGDDHSERVPMQQGPALQGPYAQRDDTETLTAVEGSDRRHQHQHQQNSRCSVVSSASCFYDALEEPEGTISSFRTMSDASDKVSLEEAQMEVNTTDATDQREQVHLSKKITEKQNKQMRQKSPNRIWKRPVPAHQQSQLPTTSADTSADAENAEGTEIGYRFRPAIGPPRVVLLGCATTASSLIEVETNVEMVGTAPPQAEVTVELPNTVSGGIHYYYDNRMLLSGSGSAAVLTLSPPPAAPALAAAATVPVSSESAGSGGVRCLPLNRRKLLILIACLTVVSFVAAAVTTGIVFGIQLRR